MSTINQGVGAAIKAEHAAMQAPCVAEQPAAALVAHAHHPTGPVVPATRPDPAMLEILQIEFSIEHIDLP